jgi:hypothetical protein
MRRLCFVLGVLLLPLPAAAQQSFSLPPIGLPLPSIGLRPAPWWEPTPMPAWEKRQLPEWERSRQPPWEKGHEPRRVGRGEHPSNVIGPQVVYYYLPYPVAVVEQPPQVIVVQQPPVTHVVTVEVPSREPREDPPPAPREPEPPFVPGGDRTVYVIPGCYVGNVPPTNLKLPPHCDVKKVTTFNP